MTRAATLALSLSLPLGALLSACDDPVVVGDPNVAQQGATPTPPTSPPPAAEVPAETTVEAEPDAGTPDTGLDYSDEDFVEVEVENRDPFRDFASSFRTQAAPRVQLEVIMPNVSIDEMRLIAVITGMPQPRAMLLDRNGVGHVVKPGDWIGRPEMIQTGGDTSLAVPLNWRVERIRSAHLTRPAEVVLTRRDPNQPDRPPLTRVIPLFEEDPEAAQRLQIR